MTQAEVLAAVRQFRQEQGSTYPIIRIGIFGSAARNALTDESDVDVVVELAQPSLFALVGIKQDLETRLGRHVDIVRYRDTMNAFLKRRIEQEAIYV